VIQTFFITRGQGKHLDELIFDLFDLTATSRVSISDLSNMLLNLPLEAIIVDFNGISKVDKNRFKILRAPADTDGIRRKRKLLAQIPGQKGIQG